MWIFEPLWPGIKGKAASEIAIPIFHAWGHVAVQTSIALGMRILLVSDPRDIRALNHALVQDTRVFTTRKGRSWGPLLKRYRRNGKELVACDSDGLDSLIPWTRADLVETYHPDVMGRGVGDFISHDPDKVADAVCRVYCGLSVPDYGGLSDGGTAD